jgi:hypothetical protein
MKASKNDTCKLLLLCTENPPDMRPTNAQKTAINETTVQLSHQGCVDRLLTNGAKTGPGVPRRTIQTSAVFHPRMKDETRPRLPLGCTPAGLLNNGKTSKDPFLLCDFAA